MELFCCENQHFDVSVISQPDATLLGDERVLRNMLAMEHVWTLRQSYFDTVQKQQIKPEMRRILTTWMAEVCEDQQCEDVVLPLATILLDNFLNVHPVTKDKLQLAGCVCLLVASKLRQCHYLSVDQLVYYTDYSITVQQLLEWELILLNVLNWNIAAVTPNDFLDPLLARLPQIEQLPQLKRHAGIFISLSSTEYSFAFHKPSLVAVASLCVAAVANDLKSNFVDAMRSCLHRITAHPQESISSCIASIEDLFSSSVSSVHQMSVPTSKRSTSGHSLSKSSSNGSQTECSSTPTDVLDVCTDRAF